MHRLVEETGQVSYKMSHVPVLSWVSLSSMAWLFLDFFMTVQEVLWPQIDCLEAERAWLLVVLLNSLRTDSQMPPLSTRPHSQGAKQSTDSPPELAHLSFEKIYMTWSPHMFPCWINFALASHQHVLMDDPWDWLVRI